MDYDEFLRADILCMIHDYGAMSAEEIVSILDADKKDVDLALFEMVLEEKLREVGDDKYDVIDELTVRRLKKALAEIF